MNTTRILSEADIIPNRAAGYRLALGELKNQAWVAPLLNTTADGSLYFTVLDLAKWDGALYTEKLLKRASLDQMWTVAKTRRRETERRQLWIGVVCSPGEWPPAAGTWRRVAGVHYPDLPLCGGAP